MTLTWILKYNLKIKIFDDSDIVNSKSHDLDLDFNSIIQKKTL
jgi:hypothetical protein